MAKAYLIRSVAQQCNIESWLIYLSSFRLNDINIIYSCRSSILKQALQHQTSLIWQNSSFKWMSKCFIKCYCDAVIHIKLAINFPLIFFIFIFLSFSFIAFSVVCFLQNLGVRSVWHNKNSLHKLIINMAVDAL